MVSDLKLQSSDKRDLFFMNSIEYKITDHEIIFVKEKLNDSFSTVVRDAK